MTHSAATTDQPLDESTRRQDDVLERLIAVATAIEEEWAHGARRVEALERQAELVRDEVRERTALLEDQQAEVMMELARLRPVDDIALVLGVSPTGARHLLLDAARRVASRIPEPRLEPAD